MQRYARRVPCETAAHQTEMGTPLSRLASTGVTAKFTELPMRANATTNPKARASLGPSNHLHPANNTQCSTLQAATRAAYRTVKLFWATVSDSPPRPNTKRPRKQVQ